MTVTIEFNTNEPPAKDGEYYVATSDGTVEIMTLRFGVWRNPDDVLGWAPLRPVEEQIQSQDRIA